MMIDKDKFPTENEYIIHTVTDGENLLRYDRIQLVRCKDCKYKVETEDGEWNPEDIVCDYWASDGLEADDFCSRGELK